jgi:hypothetical protein
MQRRITRLWIVAMTLGLTTLGFTAPAAAVPPSNDTRAGAVEVDALPFMYSEDTTEATASGPKDCNDSGSVFFRFVSATTRTVQVDTVGSNYRTELSVIKKTADGAKLIRCTDDSHNLGPWTAARFQAAAGIKYFLVVSRCCRSGRDGGGDLVLNVTEVTDEFEGNLIFTEGTVDPATGHVTLSGTSTCSRPSVMDFEGGLWESRPGTLLAQGGFFAPETWAYCLPNASIELTLVVIPLTDVEFGPGDAILWWDWVEFADFDRVYPRFPGPTAVTLT